MSDAAFPYSKVGDSGAKKRKAECTLGPSRKKLKSVYNDEYRELYNLAVVGHFHSPSAGHSQTLKPSQIGSSVWSVAEKESFFHLLARKGRHDLRAISVALGSKSEPEIAEYVELLHKRLIDAELLLQRPLFLRKPDFEAAFELSSECTAFLDRAGDALSVLQQEQDEETERAKQGKTWLLTPRIGTWVLSQIRHGIVPQNRVSQLLPEAILLNLSNFLWLSKRFFMNSSDLEYNWTSYAEGSIEPAILHTAFTDFHTLALGTMKRLIQSTLHFAISRSRAEQQSNDQQQRIVTEHDVAAAVTALHMRTSVKSYWSGVPRRCNLRVVEDEDSTYASNASYSDDDVDIPLKSPLEDEHVSQASGDDESMDYQDSARPEMQSSSCTDSESDETNPAEHQDGSSSSQQDEEVLSKEEEQEQQCDATLENLDRIRSKVEEARLWELLDEHVASESDAAEQKSNFDCLFLTRKAKEELVDWTSRIDYDAEWEVLDAPLPTWGPSQGAAASHGRHVSN